PSAHPFGEGGACPAEFRVDDDTAVAAVRVRGVEVLVDILGGIERAEGFEGGHDRIVEEGLCGFDGFGEMLLLGLVAVEHGRPVLGADVVALTVEARGVVAGEEQAEDDLFGDDVGVEGHLQGFGVAGHAGADLAVAGVVGVAAGVAGDHFSHAGGPLVDGVEAPEAAGAESESLKIAHDSYNDDTRRLFPAAPAHITKPDGREKPSSAAAFCVEGWCQNFATDPFVARDRISALSRKRIPDRWSVSWATMRADQPETSSAMGLPCRSVPVNAIVRGRATTAW